MQSSQRYKANDLSRQVSVFPRPAFRSNWSDIGQISASPRNPTFQWMAEVELAAEAVIMDSRAQHGAQAISIFFEHGNGSSRATTCPTVQRTAAQRVVSIEQG